MNLIQKFTLFIPRIDNFTVKFISRRATFPSLNQQKLQKSFPVSQHRNILSPPNIHDDKFDTKLYVDYQDRE